MKPNIKFIAKYSIEGVENGTLEKCLSYIKDKDILGIDIETSRKFKIGTYDESVYKTGLDPYLSRVIMLQIGDLSQQFVIDTRDYSQEELQPILDVLNYNPNLILIGHNLKFEAKHLKYNYGINFHTIWDTMLMEITLYNGLSVSLGLADLAQRYLGVQKKTEALLFELPKRAILTLDAELLAENQYAITPFEAEASFQIDKSTRLQFINIWDKNFTQRQVLYGADDIIFPILIRERQVVGRVLKNKLVHNPKVWQKIENHYSLVLADIELNGMPINQQKWRDLHDKNYIVYKDREKKITDWVLANYPQYSAGTYDIFGGEAQCHIKWTSNKQVATLFKSWGICPRAYSKQTKQVEDTVGAVELLRQLPNKLKVLYEKNKDVEIVDLDTFTLAYLLFKKSEQSVTTFGKDWLKNVHPITQRVHTSYRQILNTTRISSTNPNLNNISGGEWRECFEVKEGNIMVNLDFASQEVRQLAAVCGDYALMSFFIAGDDFYGDDFHAFTATKVYKILENNPDLVVPPKEIKNEAGEIINNEAFTEDDKERRGNSKQVTFGMAFGKSVFTFALDLGISVAESSALIDSYLDAFPDLKEHFKRCEKRADEQDYISIDNFTGAKWFCPFFDEIKILQKQAWDYFPPDFQKLSWRDKQSVTKQLSEMHPEIKQFRQQAGRLRGSYINKHKNYIIQGACAQMLKIAMNIARKNIIEEGKAYLLCGNIYDEVLCEVEKSEGDTAGKMLKQAMEKGGAIISPSMPQVANYVLSHDWKH